MSYSLSLLDKSPIADGANAADALRFTTTLAQRLGTAQDAPRTGGAR